MFRLTWSSACTGGDDQVKLRMATGPFHALTVSVTPGLMSWRARWRPITQPIPSCADESPVPAELSQWVGSNCCQLRRHKRKARCFPVVVSPSGGSGQASALRRKRGRKFIPTTTKHQTAVKPLQSTQLNIFWAVISDCISLKAKLWWVQPSSGEADASVPFPGCCFFFNWPRHKLSLILMKEREVIKVQINTWKPCAAKKCSCGGGGGADKAHLYTQYWSGCVIGPWKVNRKIIRLPLLGLWYVDVYICRDGIIILYCDWWRFQWLLDSVPWVTFWNMHSKAQRFCSCGSKDSIWWSQKKNKDWEWLRLDLFRHINVY